MMKCKECGASHFRKEIVAEFHDDLMGIPVVVMQAVERETCLNCGRLRGILIPNLGGLIAATALKRATLPYKLNGREIRFCRKALGWKAKELADRLKVTPEAVSRWENDQNPISPHCEQYLRLVVFNLLGDRAPRIKCRCSADDIVYMRVKPRAAERMVPLRFFLWKKVEQANSVGDEQWAA